MKIFFKYTLLVLFITILSSCSEDDGYEDLNLPTSPAAEVSGDWFVQTFVGGSLALDFVRITTSNTAADSASEINIFDHQNIWWFNFKTPVDINALTFSGSDLFSDVNGYQITVNVSNGTIVKNGTTSTSGRTADSISFDIEFSDDPGTIYQLTGYRRTGFLEDEH